MKTRPRSSPRARGLKRRHRCRFWGGHFRFCRLHYLGLNTRQSHCLMKNIVPIGIGFVVSYLTLVWAVGHLGAVSSVLCSSEFTLPAIACRFRGLGITLLLIPVTGVVAFLLTRRVLTK